MAARQGTSRWLSATRMIAIVLCYASVASSLKGYDRTSSAMRHLQVSENPIDVVTSAPAVAPSTNPPTAAPFTQPTATEPPATSPPLTEPPVTQPPPTPAPATEPPATAAPATQPPPTDAPATQPPLPEVPPIQPPPTEAPATVPPPTEAPATQPPETLSPSTDAPSTPSPSTEAPTTVSPTTDPPSATLIEPSPSATTPVTQPPEMPPVETSTPSDTPSDVPSETPSPVPSEPATAQPSVTPDGGETPLPTWTDTPAPGSTDTPNPSTSVPLDPSASREPPANESPDPTGRETPDLPTEGPTNAPEPSTSPSDRVPPPTSGEPTPSSPEPPVATDDPTPQPDPSATPPPSVTPEVTPPVAAESPMTDSPAVSEPPTATDTPQPPPSDVEPTQTPVTEAPSTQEPTPTPSTSTPEPSATESAPPPPPPVEEPAPTPDVTETPQPVADPQPVITETPLPVTETPPPVTETPQPVVTETPSPVTDPPPPVTDPPPPVTDPPPPVTDPPPPVTETPPPVTETPPPVVTETPSPVTDPPPPVTDPPPIATDPPAPETPKPPVATEPPPPPASPDTPEPPVVTESSPPAATDTVSISNVPPEPSSITPVPITALPVIDVPIAVETNAPEVSAETLAKKDEKQSTDSNAPSTPTPTSDDVYWQPTAEPEKYVRGQTPIDDVKDPWKDINGSRADGNTTSHTQPLIIGGKQRGSGNVAGTPYAQAGTLAHDIVRYIASSVSAISVGLLLFFHVVSLSPTLQWSKIAWSPNTWEFCVYVAYLQQMAAMSQLTLLKSPFFLWDFTDAFAWTNFLIQRTTGAVAAKRRLLETVLILDGIVGYADRIGLKESHILTHTVIGYAVVTAGCLLAFSIATFVAYQRKRRRESRHSCFQAWGFAYRLLGLCWLVWYFSLYPLSVMASFEIYMEIHSSLLTPGLLLLALFVLAVVCTLMLAIALRAVWFRNEDELRDIRTIAIFGVFYVDLRHKKRLFFVFGALLQLLTGICIGVLDSTATLLSLLIAAHAVYVVLVLVVKPFASKPVRAVTLAVEAFKMINFAIGFPFLPDSTMPSRRRVTVANVFIGLNTCILVVWFVRHLVLFAYSVKAFLHRNEEQEASNLVSLESSIQHAKYEAGGDTPSLQPTSASASRYPLYLCWSRSMSLSDSASMAWGHDTTPRTAYAPVMESR